jgi:cystathionine beta-lyase
VVFETESEESVSSMVRGYRLFKIGASWCGYESLVMTAYPHKNRTAGSWDETGFVLRYHLGLEDPDDLIEDLEHGFSRLGQAVPKI